MNLYAFQDVPDVSSAAGAGVFAVMGIFYLAVIVLLVAALWKVFTKAGEPGWAAIVPIYNVIVLLKIAGKPVWWLVLFFIPVVSFIIAILVAISLAEKFGRGAGYGIGLALLPMIFYPMLGFGGAQYVGPKTA